MKHIQHRLQTSLNDIERKARYNKDHKFENLYRLLNKWSFAQSWPDVNKRASSGIDKISAKEFAANLTEEKKVLEEELKKELKTPGFGIANRKDILGMKFPF